MKHLKLFFALFAMLALGVGNAWGETAKVDFSTLYSDDTDVSSTTFSVVEGISLAFDQGTGSTAPKYYKSGTAVRLYPKGTMTVSSTIGKITKITLAYGTSDKTNTISVNCGSFSTPNWTGEADEVIFTIGGTSGHRRIKSVEVTYTPSSGEESTPAQLPTPSGLTVDDITSSGATLSWNEVTNASSYVVTIVDGESFEEGYTVTGTTTTVSDLESSTYYLWTVTAIGDGTNYANSLESATGEFTTSTPATGGEEPGSGGEETWTLVTNASDLKVGDQIVIAAKGSDYALGTTQNTKNRDAVSVIKGTNTITIGNDVQIITLETGNVAETFAFNTGSGYLYAASSSENLLKTQSTLNDNGSWAISITSEGVATIKAQGTNTRNLLKKNSQSALFSCYGSGQSDVAIYKKVTSSGETPDKQQPELSYTTTEYNVNLGDAFTAPTLNNPYTLAVTYSSSNEDVATVDETGGTVTIKAAGKVTITASFAGNEDYVAATASYNITITDPNVGEAKFVAGTDKSGELSISKNGVTVEFTGGTFSRDDNYRCYANQSMTISYADGNITKIVIECTANDGAENGPGQFTTETATYSYSGKVGTWTGEANSVTFTADKQVRMTTITVYYKQDNRAEAGIAWNPTSVTLTQGKAFTAPTLQNPKSVAGITYESSNDEVATVTEEGEIALASAIGTATITATFAGDATYKPATATCTITVNEYIETIDGEWELVTDASKLQAGMEIIIASVADAGTVKTMGKQGNNNRSAVASTVDGDKLNPTVGTTVITLEDCQLYEGLFALKTKDGYLYAASSSSNHLKSQNGINKNACWTITITEGVAAVVATNSSNHNIMRYNKTSDLFSCYLSGLQDIVIYAKKPAHTRTTSAGRYGTICLPGNIVKCLGATLYEVAGKDGLRVVFDEVLTPEAGMPYIFLAHNAEVLFYCGDQTDAAGNYNSLYGTFSVLQDAQLDGMYMVQNNKIVQCAATGCGVAENRAYFNGTELETLGSAPAPMPGRRRITMGTESENTTTGTEDVIAPEGQTLKLIENGQLVIIRNGEKYNAQGQKL